MNHLEGLAMLSATVPLQVTPEAAARIAELGIQAEVDRMIEHAVKTVGGIRRVEIMLMDPYEMYDEPHLSATAYRDFALWSDSNPDVDRFGDWKIESFSPDILWRFNLHIRADWPHAR
jgi:hypothetical protein